MQRVTLSLLKFACICLHSPVLITCVLSFSPNYTISAHEVENSVYLPTFFERSRTIRDRVEKDRPLQQVIRAALASHKAGTVTLFSSLVPGIALKRRLKGEARVEMAVNADLWTPELNVSPFIVPLGRSFESSNRHIAYLVQDFGELPHASHNTKHFPSVRRAMTHAILRGYGVIDQSIPQSHDTRAIDALIDKEWWVWENMFLSDNESNWALIDLDMSDFGKHTFEIGDGTRGTGRFSRLANIFDTLLGREQTLDDLQY